MIKYPVEVYLNKKSIQWRLNSLHDYIIQTLVHQLDFSYDFNELK